MMELRRTFRLHKLLSSSFSHISTHKMATEKEWIPPARIEELYSATGGNKFSSINAPTAGARTQVDLPVGNASFQLYSLGTPNGQKVSIMLEELGIEYDAHICDISKGEQFTSGFVGVNPNSKIPCAVDHVGPDGQPITLFESGSIVIYLADKHKKFIPDDFRLRTEVMHWVFWQMAGQGPMTGNFGHFFVYAPKDKLETRDYGTARYGMEVQRLMSVLDKHLEGRTYLVAEQYTIADIVCFPWAHQLFVGYIHTSGRTAAEFLNVSQYKNVVAWVERLKLRPAVVKGMTVCKNW